MKYLKSYALRRIQSLQLRLCCFCWQWSNVDVSCHPPVVTDTNTLPCCWTQTLTKAVPGEIDCDIVNVGYSWQQSDLCSLSLNFLIGALRPAEQYQCASK